MPSLGSEGAIALQPAPGDAPPRRRQGRDPAQLAGSNPRFIAGTSTPPGRQGARPPGGSVGEGARPLQQPQAPSFSEQGRRRDRVQPGHLRRSTSPMRSWTRRWWSPPIRRGRSLVRGDERSRRRAPSAGRPTGFPSEVSMLGYLNLGGLIALGEQAGLAANPAYATFAPEIHRLQALGLAVHELRDELSTDARLVVGGGSRAAGGGARAHAQPTRTPTASAASDTLATHDDRGPVRERVPVHLGVGHRGAPGQDLRPDLGRRARRGDGRRSGRSRRLRVPRQHRPGRRRRRDLHRDVRRHPEDRARDPAPDRLRPGQVRVRRRHVRGDHGDRRAVARHRPGSRHGVRGPHRPERRATSSTGSEPATRE